MTVGPGDPVPFSAFMEAALYDEETGFYATGGQAGRRGDFLTSPEVGPLFGAVIARALDEWWDELGQPDRYDVIEAGAGPGTLARAIYAAKPRCRPALRYTMVERAAAQRAKQPAGEGVASVEVMPADLVHVILANELLDNLPFDLLVYDGGWYEAWVGQEPDGRLVELLRPAGSIPALSPEPSPGVSLLSETAMADGASIPHGARAPRQEQAAAWVTDAVARLQSGGRVVVFDYCSTTQAMATRPWREWLRTYRGHQRGGHYLAYPGEQDITGDVALDQLPTPTEVTTQARWLADYGIHDLVAAGRAIWQERAATGDLASLKARSRIREAEALLEPSGLGAFTVAEWHRVDSPAVR
jgi:SAM-dependent MidA family methyltransferase